MSGDDDANPKPYSDEELVEVLAWVRTWTNATARIPLKSLQTIFLRLGATIAEIRDRTDRAAQERPGG